MAFAITNQIDLICYNSTTFLTYGVEVFGKIVYDRKEKVNGKGRER